jgi:uncharacterized protein YecT (DUF1311 family)
MQWFDMAKDALLLLLGGVGSAMWYFWRRKAEQAPVLDNIQKAEKLLSLRKELDNTNYTVQDLKNLEDALMGRAEIAKELSNTFEQEAQLFRAIEMDSLMTQEEINIVAEQSYRKTQRQLDKVIEQIKDYFSPEKCVRFDKVNQAWWIYLQSHADFSASEYEGGSIQPVIYASTLETATIARLVELEAELKFMKDTQVRSVELDAF